MADKVIRIKTSRPQDVRGDRYTLHRGNVLDAYPDRRPRPDSQRWGLWRARDSEGDTVSADGLVDWYAPHVAQWSKRAKPSTSLWFWNTPVGWATVHPLLEAGGREYVQRWSLGTRGAVAYRRQRERQHHSTIPPVVTEVSALYRRRLALPRRMAEFSGAAMATCRMAAFRPAALPVPNGRAVKNAATREVPHRRLGWYWPPGKWSNAWPNTPKKNGKPTSRPYFSIDGHVKSWPNNGTPSVPYGTMSAWTH